MKDGRREIDQFKDVEDGIELDQMECAAPKLKAEGAFSAKSA